METDYSHISDIDFILKLREYAAFLVAHSNPNGDLSFTTKPLSPQKLTLIPDEWKWFSLGNHEMFKGKAGKYHYQSEYDEGCTPYLGATALDNGTTKFIDIEPEFPFQTITVGKISCPTFYQPVPFCATSDVNVVQELSGVVNKFPDFPCFCYKFQRSV